MMNKELYATTEEYLAKMVPPRRQNGLVKDCYKPCVQLELLGQVATGQDADHGIYFHIVRMIDAEMLTIA